jgi:diketogulonate reductase-like aldo/keto reductase
VIPKSVHEKRIQENFAVFDFELTPEEITAINQLNKDHRFGADPDNFDF